MKYRLLILYAVLVIAAIALTAGSDLLQILSGIKSGGGMTADIVLLLLGMVLITHGGDLFTDSAVAIARATRIPPVIIGATIVSMATTFPEFMVSFTSSIGGVPEFAVGNALGSCCCNIGLIVGTCAVLQGILAKRKNELPGIPVSRVTLRGPGMFMLTAGVSVLIFSLFDNGGQVDTNNNPIDYAISRWQAGVLVLILIAYLLYSVRLAFQARYEAAMDDEDADAQEEEIREPLGRQIALFLAGAVLVVLGSRLLVSNAEAIATSLKVPKLWIGLTVLAIGTSLPEYMISLMAVIKGHGALGVGNIIGANVLNIGWVVATCALYDPLAIKFQTIVLDGPVVLLLMGLLVFAPMRSERISSRLGAVVFSIYVAWYETVFVLFG